VYGSAVMHARFPLARQFVALVIYLGAFAGLSQQQLPELEQLRLAAERGDPAAQHKFGEFYLSHDDASTAYEWFQKAAKQGNIDSQYRLGQMLLDGRPKTPNSKKPVSKNVDEGLRWLFLVANQGHGSAQLDLGRAYESGKTLKRDLVEAYKWYKLLSQKPGGSYYADLNHLVLAMTHEQIEEGEKRANEWRPHQMTEQELLQVIYLRQIFLKAIATSGGRRVAVINGEPLVAGGQAKVRAGDKLVQVRCLEIKDKSAMVEIDGLAGARELHL
jgi:TPR repeat protein